MSLNISSSFFKNIYTHTFKEDQVKYRDIQLKAGDPNTNGIAASTKYWAAPTIGKGGPVAVVGIADTGRIGKVPTLEGHKMPVTDLKFSPFSDSILATAGGDGDICIWNIPEEGVTEVMRDPVQRLQGHDKKIQTVVFHPAANNVLASASQDKTVKVWDIEKNAAAFSHNLADRPFDLDFNLDGSQVAVGCRDKKIRIIDTRSGDIAFESEAFPGVKPFRINFCKRLNRIIAAGFGRRAESLVNYYDPAQPEAPISKAEVDRESGSMMTVFDEDSGIFLLTKRGGTSIRYYEASSGELFLSGAKRKYGGTQKISMIGTAPKLGCDTENHEVVKLFVNINNDVEPFSIRVPLKTTNFVQEAFPDTFHIEPALTAEAFLGGETAEPNTVSMRPGERPVSVTTSFEAKEASPTGSNAELDSLRTELNALKAENEALRAENEQLKQRLVEMESSA